MKKQVKAKPKAKPKPKTKKLSAVDTSGVEELDAVFIPNSVNELDDVCSKLWDEICELEEHDPQRATLITNYNIAAGACNRLSNSDRVLLITKQTKLTGFRPEPEHDVVPEPLPEKSKQSKQSKGTAKAKTVVTAAELKVGDVIKFVFAGGRTDGAILEFTSPDKSTMWAKCGRGYRYHIKNDDLLLDGQTPIEKIGSSKPPQKTVSIGDAGPIAGKGKPKAKPTTSSKRTELQVMKRTPQIDAILKEPISGADHIRKVYDLVTGWDEKTKKAKYPDRFDVEDFVIMSGINRSRVIGCLQKFRS